MLLASLLFVIGCGTLVGSPEGYAFEGGTAKNKPSEGASTSFALTDSAEKDADTLLVTFTSLSVSTDGKTWVDIPLTWSEAFDGRSLQQSHTALLARRDNLPPGTYHSTKLVVGTAPAPAPKTIHADGSTSTLTIGENKTAILVEADLAFAKGDINDYVLDIDTKDTQKKNADGNSCVWNPSLHYVVADEAVAKSGGILV